MITFNCRKAWNCNKLVYIIFCISSMHECVRRVCQRRLSVLCRTHRWALCEADCFNLESRCRLRSWPHASHMVPTACTADADTWVFSLLQCFRNVFLFICVMGLCALETVIFCLLPVLWCKMNITTVIYVLRTRQNILCYNRSVH